MPTELQNKILANTKQLHKLANMISGLPKCAIRDTLQAQHDNILLTLCFLYITKDMSEPGTCDFGFTDLCPDCVCDLCPDFKSTEVFV